MKNANRFYTAKTEIEMHRDAQLTLELVDLICDIKTNIEACDDDKEKSWEVMKRQWETVVTLMRDYIIEGEA